MRAYKFIIESHNTTWTLTRTSWANDPDQFPERYADQVLLQRTDNHDSDTTTSIYLPEELLVEFAEQWAKEKLGLEEGT